MLTMEELQRKLESYPERLQKALTRLAEVEGTIERLQEEIEMAQMTSRTEEPENTDETPVEGETYEQAKFRYDRKAAQLELQVRQNPSAFGITVTKPTEGTIQAVLLANDELAPLKERMIQLDGRQRYRHIFTRPESKVQAPVDEKLRQRLWKAQESVAQAEAHVESLRAELETYRMLTVILTSREVSASLSLG